MDVLSDEWIDSVLDPVLGVTDHRYGAAGGDSMARVREIGHMEEDLEKQEIIGSIGPLFGVGGPGVMGIVMKDQASKLQEITKVVIQRERSFSSCSNVYQVSATA